MRDRLSFARILFFRRKAVIAELFIAVGVYDLLAGQVPEKWPLPHLGDLIGGLPPALLLVVGLILLLVVVFENAFRHVRDVQQEASGAPGGQDIITVMKTYADNVEQRVSEAYEARIQVLEARLAEQPITGTGAATLPRLEASGTGRMTAPPSYLRQETFTLGRRAEVLVAITQSDATVTLSNLTAQMKMSSTFDTALTVRLLVDGHPSGLMLSIPGSTTGVFQDGIHTYEFSPVDRLVRLRCELEMGGDVIASEEKVGVFRGQ